MLAIAIITLVLLGIYVAIGSIRQRKLLINKFVAVLALISIVVIVISGSIEDRAQVAIPDYQEIAPSVQDAPYVVQTSSRAYYVATFKDTEEVLTLTNFYIYDKKKWQNSDIPLHLDRTIYGEVRPIKRNIGG